ncbi:MAG: hypothetical protein GXP25_00900 [Planctomycetes bacterium]|nr:hypothetical protein [Planctomycetota bacterium]
MKKRNALIILLILAGAAGGVALFGAAYSIYAHHARMSMLGKLFDGKAQQVERDPVSYYPTVIYDLEAYSAGLDTAQSETAKAPIPDLATKTDEPKHEWADGAGKEELEKRIRQRAALDGVTAPTMAVRLRTPSVFRAQRPSKTLWVSYPPNGALFPPGFCTPCVEWEDSHNNAWQVIVQIEGTDKQWRHVTEEKQWWVPDDIWGEVLADGVDHGVRVEVKGIHFNEETGRREGEVQVSTPVTFRISPDPADRYVVYRLVRPPFSTYKTPDMFVRDIASFDTRLFLSARRSYCFNCHTFSSKSGTSGKLSIQSRYMVPRREQLFRTYFGVFDLDRQTGRKFKLPFKIQMTTFMAWSPDGTKLALSANQQVTAFEPIVYETQSAGEPTSDIAVFQPEQETVALVPGASDPDHLEIYPRWTLDGKSIVFCWASAGYHPELIHYDLHVVPYNGGKGGKAVPIKGASQNGRSNYYARFSPDGKWMSFCQSNGGSLIKSSSDIYLMKSDFTGEPHRLESNTDYGADSWHSWSSNGKWIVFASKRNTVIARLYMTHIDEQGHASPAIRVPLKEAPMKCFNIPEFLQNSPRVKEKDLYNTIRVDAPPVEVVQVPKGS